MNGDARVQIALLHALHLLEHLLDRPGNVLRGEHGCQNHDAQRDEHEHDQAVAQAAHVPHQQIAVQVIADGEADGGHILCQNADAGLHRQNVLLPDHGGIRRIDDGVLRIGDKQLAALRPVIRAEGIIKKAVMDVQHHNAQDDLPIGQRAEREQRAAERDDGLAAAEEVILPVRLGDGQPPGMRNRLLIKVQIGVVPVIAQALGGRLAAGVDLVVEKVDEHDVMQGAVVFQHRGYIVLHEGCSVFSVPEDILQVFHRAIFVGAVHIHLLRDGGKRVHPGIEVAACQVNHLGDALLGLLLQGV